MKSILFVDPAAPRGYTNNTLRTEALGGSEASLIRVARALAKDNDVCVFQLCDPHRGEASVAGIRHIGLEGLTQRPDVVVHFRTGALMKDMKEEMPDARHLMWAQDFFPNKEALEGLEGEEVVVLSVAHEQQLLEQCAESGVKLKTVHQMPNPVEMDAAPQGVVARRLGFFSSPHKGLEQVIGHFLALSRAYPDLSMVYANPGYMPSLEAQQAGVTNLGKLPHYRVMEELSKCEVLFYPQTVFPETFGIVLAEANAMGVPVLSHDFGAAPEVLRQPGNAVRDCSKFEEVERGLLALLDCKVKPKLDERFTMQAVADRWRDLLGG